MSLSLGRLSEENYLLTYIICDLFGALQGYDSVLYLSIAD